MILSLACVAGSSRISAQLPMTVPWSSALNVNFGTGINPVGSPLSVGFSDFTFSGTDAVANGQYTVVNTPSDGGHMFYGPFTFGGAQAGYIMQVSFNSTFSNKVVFGDTVRGLCSNVTYLFWAAIRKISGCFSPGFTFIVETTGGVPIGSYQTGQVGGGRAVDHASWYNGYYDNVLWPPIPFYGFSFQLPAGVQDIVVKIVTNAASSPGGCTAFFSLDNILLTPVGPDVRISSSRYPGGYIAAGCYQGNVPVELQGNITGSYLAFGTPNFISASYTNPAYQWQLSLDNGYTWTDIPGETNINISHVFNSIDTFWMRMRVSEAGDISNPKCSNVSNIMQIQVDGLPKDFSLATNSPVCTDGDLTLTVSGGASYQTFGPNGFFDDSPFPHIYHPRLADSGWYKAQIISFGGCVVTDSQYVRVVGPDIRVSPDRVMCYGDTVQLHASGGTRYSWTPATGLNRSDVADPVASPVATTHYEVKVSDNSGCSDFGKITVSLRNGLLKPDFVAPEVACPNESIQFTDTSQGKITNWEWNFGNGQVSNLRNPLPQKFPVLNDVQVPVQLTVTDSSGCEQAITKYIRSVNNCYIAVPTAFTPNNDGLNDLFGPMNAYKATHLNFQVFNRWGRLIFSTKDWTRKWDGNLGGVPQPAGVYVWMLNYTDASQKPVFLKGTTVLIR